MVVIDMPTCMVCGKWIDDGRTKFVGKRCTCKNEYKNADGSTELRFIIKSETSRKKMDKGGKKHGK
jgi:hypothetical protein